MLMCCLQRSPVSAGASAALAHAQVDGQGAAGLEDPALRVQLEERQGLHHPSRQETRRRRPRTTG